MTMPPESSGDSDIGSTIRMTIAELCERSGFTQFDGPLGGTARYELTSTR